MVALPPAEIFRVHNLANDRSSLVQPTQYNVSAAYQLVLRPDSRHFCRSERLVAVDGRRGRRRRIGQRADRARAARTARVRRGGRRWRRRRRRRAVVCAGRPSIPGRHVEFNNPGRRCASACVCVYVQQSAHLSQHHHGHLSTRTDAHTQSAAFTNRSQKTVDVPAMAPTVVVDIRAQYPSMILQSDPDPIFHDPAWNLRDSRSTPTTDDHQPLSTGLSQCARVYI